MKRILLAGALAFAAALAAESEALAADLPPPIAPQPRAPAAYMTPVFSWTGFYVGLNAGAAFFNQGSATAVFNPTGAVAANGQSIHSTGFAGGGQVGANFQSGQFVFGLEGDVDYLSNQSSITGGSLGGGTDTRQFKLDLLSTVRGRVGFAFDRSLIYGTGGLAMGEYQVTRTQLTGGAIPAGTNDSYSQLRLGWAAGAGFEYAMTDNWTARAEWVIAGLESTTNTFTTANITQTSPTAYVNVVRGGVNYKFGY